MHQFPEIDHRGVSNKNTGDKDDRIPQIVNFQFSIVKSHIVDRLLPIKYTKNKIGRIPLIVNIQFSIVNSLASISYVDKLCKKSYSFTSMVIYDGIYRLRGTPQTASLRKPPACAWRVRIINLTLSQPQVDHLREFVVLAIPAGEGVFHSSCADSMGRSICRDFCLDVRRVIWIEHFSNGGNHPLSVAVFHALDRFGSDSLCTIDWRPIRTNELKMLRRFVSEVDRFL
jgi:hypothetical protein